MEILQKIDDFVKVMIDEGFYRYKPSQGASIMFNGEIKWLYSEFSKTRQFIIGEKKDGSPKYLDLNTIDMNRKDFPIITKTIYDINLPYGKVKDMPVFNTAKYLNPVFPIKANANIQDVSIFWKHLEYLCGDVPLDDKEWVKDWLSDIFQDPNNKKGTALVFIGNQGCGKGIFFDILMSALLGEYHHHADEKEYGGKFNTELRDKLLINFDEGFATKSKLFEAKLKSFITQPKFKIEGKGKDSITVLNPARAVFTTNSRFAINTANDDRRFAVFRTIKEDFATPEYFDNFIDAIGNRDMLEKFMYELTTRKIVSRLNKPPITDEKETQKIFSADKITDWFNFIISTPRNYQVPLEDNNQCGFNRDGYLWNNFKDNERCMFKESGLISYMNYPGNNEGINSTNKLCSALNAYLKDHKEWEILNETKRVEQKSGFNFGKENQARRMWVFRRKPIQNIQSV